MLVLIVDDNPAAVYSVRALLEHAGHHVIAALSVTGAEDLLDAAPTPDVVITDYLLDDGTGLDVLEAVRALPRRIPVVLLTGLDPASFAASGFDACLQKPARADALLGAMRRALG